MLFLSIHPRFVQAIVENRKTVELRKRRPSAHVGSTVVIYATMPQCEVVATARLENVECESPRKLWTSVRHSAGVSKAEFEAYFFNREIAVGIFLADVRVLNHPVKLAELRRLWSGFQPPQQYRYLDSKQQRLISSRTSTIVPSLRTPLQG